MSDALEQTTDRKRILYGGYRFGRENKTVESMKRAIFELRDHGVDVVIVDYEVVEQLKNKNSKLLAVVNELMAEIEFDLNYHACRTGDCPHEKQYECDESLIDSTKESLAKADQMLKELGVKMTKLIFKGEG